jgi:hypothetical protein
VVFLVVFSDWSFIYVIFGVLGLAVIYQGLVAFEVINFMSPDWERKIAERKLGRKL